MTTSRTSASTVDGMREDESVAIGGSVDRKLKRVFDILLSAAALVICAPLLGAISLILWVESVGHVIFSQRRLGQGGRIFRMHKFRKFPAHWTDAGPGVTVAGDARMTRIGAFLEKTKLDELPQLWNILRGEMSFVGPRPESTRYADLFHGAYARVLDHVPGIFGPNQVVFRNEAGLYPAEEDPEAFYRRELFPKKAALDLSYFGNANIISDAMWILSGLWASLIGVIDWDRFKNVHARIVATDVGLVWIAWFLANVIRFSGIPARESLEGLLNGFWLLPCVMIASMSLGGCYRHPVRYFSFEDGIRLLRVVPFAWMAGFLLLLGFISRGLSFYLVPEGCLILLPLLAMPRVVNRMRWERRRAAQGGHSHKIVIYGAGRGGTAFGTWIKTTSSELSMIGFLDDDPEMRGRVVAGSPVLGRESDIPTIHEVHRFDEIWVTFEPDAIKRRRLQSTCDARGIRLVIFSELEPFSRFVSGSREGP